jgi:hypothetical protein
VRLDDLDDFGPAPPPLILEQVTEQNAVYPVLDPVGLGNGIDQSEEGLTDSWRRPYYGEDYNLMRAKGGRGEGDAPQGGEQDEVGMV